jgi:hypothetical protein
MGDSRNKKPSGSTDGLFSRYQEEHLPIFSIGHFGNSVNSQNCPIAAADRTQPLEPLGVSRLASTTPTSHRAKVLGNEVPQQPHTKAKPAPVAGLPVSRSSSSWTRRACV